MKKAWDKIGITLSSICIVHCIGLAILPALLPAMEHMGAEFHYGMAILILLTSPIAFIPGYRKHGVGLVLLWAICGITLVILGTLFDGFIVEWMSHSIVISGSITLVCAHYMNIKHSKHHHNHNHSEHCC